MSEKEGMSKAEKEARIQFLEKKWDATFTVKEGTAVGVMSFGALKEIHMVYKGYELNAKGWVVKSKKAGAGHGSFGGLHKKVPGRDKILAYGFVWPELKLTKEGKYEIVTRFEVISHIFVRPTDYAIKVEDAETKAVGRNRERIPVTILANILIRVVNPRKAWYESPSNWFEYAGTRLKTMIKDWVATKKIDEVFALTEDPGKAEIIWKEFKDNPIIKNLRSKRGIQVEPLGIDFVEVSTLEEYQKILASGKIAETRAKTDRKTKTMEADTKTMVERREKVAETIELQHIAARIEELKKTGLSPEAALEAVQTERGKVPKQIMEYKGLPTTGLPLINIGGERTLQRKSEDKQDKKPIAKEEKKKIESEEEEEQREFDEAFPG